MFHRSFDGFRLAVRELMICGKHRTGGDVGRNGSTAGKKNSRVTCGSAPPRAGRRWRSSCPAVASGSSTSHMGQKKTFGKIKLQYDGRFTSSVCDNNRTRLWHVGERHSEGDATTF